MDDSEKAKLVLNDNWCFAHNQPGIDCTDYYLIMHRDKTFDFDIIQTKGDFKSDCIVMKQLRDVKKLKVQIQED